MKALKQATGANTMQINQQVSGTYCGQKFIGTISEMRWLTVKTDGCFEYEVELDAPLTVYGWTRETLLIYALFDGSQSSYTRFQDSLQAA